MRLLEVCHTRLTACQILGAPDETHRLAVQLEDSCCSVRSRDQCLPAVPVQDALHAANVASAKRCKLAPVLRLRTQPSQVSSFLGTRRARHQHCCLGKAHLPMTVLLILELQGLSSEVLCAGKILHETLPDSHACDSCCCL